MTEIGSGDDARDRLPFDAVPPFMRKGTQALVPGLALALAAVWVMGVFHVASVSPSVTWTHGMAWVRLTPVKASVICNLICGGFCDGSRKSVNEIVSKIRHWTWQVWWVCQMNQIFLTRLQSLQRTMEICGGGDAVNQITGDVYVLIHHTGWVSQCFGGDHKLWLWWLGRWLGISSVKWAPQVRRKCVEISRSEPNWANAATSR